MQLGKKVTRLRGALSYAELGRVADCSPPTIRDIEAGIRRDTSVRIVAKLARYFRVSLDWLADDGADWPPPADDRQRAADLVRHALTRGGLADELNEEERELIANFRRLNDRRRGEAVGVLRTLANSLGGESPSRQVEKGKP